MRYITITEYVNAETGELISKSRFLREGWHKIKSTKQIKFKDNGTTCIKQYTTEVQENKQTRLEF